MYCKCFIVTVWHTYMQGVEKLWCQLIVFQHITIKRQLFYFCLELTQLSGVAAILRFPIADFSEGEDDSSSDDD